MVQALAKLVPVANALEGKLQLALLQDVLLGGGQLGIAAAHRGAVVLGISTLAHLVEIALGIGAAQLGSHQQDIGVTHEYPVLELADLKVAGGNALGIMLQLAVACLCMLGQGGVFLDEITRVLALVGNIVALVVLQLGCIYDGCRTARVAR